MLVMAGSQFNKFIPLAVMPETVTMALMHFLGAHCRRGKLYCSIGHSSTTGCTFLD